MQLDLKKMPFGRRLSRHLLYEETGGAGPGPGWAKGLYLALAAESGGGFIGGPMMGPKGFIRVVPTSGGKELGYTYSATPALVEMKTEKGGIRFTLDGTKVLRVEGSGVGLLLDGRLGFGSTCVMTKRGIEFSMNGGIYLIRALKGTLSLDCHWERKALRSTDPVITVEPDASGSVSLALYDIDEAYEMPELSDSLDQCAAATEADFKAFVEGLAIPKAEGAFFDACAYALWVGFASFKGFELAPSNKMSDQNFYSIEQAILTLPLKSAARALEILGETLSFASPQGMVPTWMAERQNLYEAVPPVYAVAVSRLIDNGSIKDVPKGQLSAFYDSMSKTVSWWLNKRMSDAGLCYYAYRHECSGLREPIFGAGTPSAAPDLAAYLALGADALSQIAALLGKDADAALWRDVYNRQLDALTTKLWDGKQLCCVNTLTGDTAPAEGMLSLIPLILGKRLPEAMINALAGKAHSIRWAKIPVIPATLIIFGLKASGRDGDAAQAAAALIESCAEGANDLRGKGTPAGASFPPASCAALLALGGLM